VDGKWPPKYEHRDAARESYTGISCPLGPMLSSSQFVIRRNLLTDSLAPIFTVIIALLSFLEVAGVYYPNQEGDSTTFDPSRTLVTHDNSSATPVLIISLDKNFCGLEYFMRREVAPRHCRLILAPFNALSLLCVEVGFSRDLTAAETFGQVGFSLTCCSPQDMAELPNRSLSSALS
jgi:hypothetical protein